MNKYNLIALVALLVVVAALPVYAVMESNRMERAQAELYDEYAADGVLTYVESCASCHGPTGEGIGAVPPLNNPGLAEADRYILYNTIARSPHGPRAFLCAMGLTLEQANLDFAAAYRDAFRASGDERSAQVCDAVQHDEVRHVALAARWLRKLAPGRSDLEAYTEAVPFPFAATRAKGRRFDAEARQRAGLSPEFIEAVRTARSKPGRMRA